MGMASRSLVLACQIFRLSGSGNYTFLRICDGMTISNSLSNTGVETSSKPSDGWCGNQPTQSISFMPVSIHLTVIPHRKASIKTRSWRTGGWRNRYGEILEDNKVLIEVISTLSFGDTLLPLIFISDGMHHLHFVCNKKESPVYMTLGRLCSKIHQMPSIHSIVIFTLLLILIKNFHIPQNQLDE